MKIKLLYYSGAGNTKFIATIVANKLIKKGHIVESIKATEKSISSLDDDFDVLYVGFPVYFRDAPELIYRIFDKIDGKNRPIMTFVIAGLYSGNAFKNIQSVSIEKGFIPVGALQLIMPGTDFLTLAVKANSLLEKLYLKNHSRNINGKIEKFVEKMEKNKKLKRARTKWYTFIDELIVKKLEVKADNQHKDWTKDLMVNMEKCTHCMKCVNGCPHGNIKYINGINFGTNCDVCLYCINNCPKSAISILQKTIDKVKFSEEKIERVFEKFAEK